MKPKDITANASIRKVALSSFIGTAIEWYAFFIFNVALFLLFFNKPFFDGGPVKGWLFFFGTYVVGFLARPVGGFVCGHFGDRLGRKKLLVSTLVITSIATFFIGILPGAEHLGIWAPWSLFALRFAQGFGIGGEWGGAVLMTVEHSPDHKRGYYGSWPQVGVPVGLFLAYVVCYGIDAKLPREIWFFDSWRLAFLLSMVLLSIGLYIRLSIPETPRFEEIKDTPSKRPLRDAWLHHRRDVMLAMGAKVAENGIFYLYTVFLLAFAKHYHLSTDTILIGVVVAALCIIAALPVFGVLSDRFGRRRIYLFGAIFAGLFVFPSFWLVASGQPALMIISIVLAMVFGWSAMYAPQASFFAELFETRVRYSGASIGAQVATIFAGGLMQAFAVKLLTRTNTYWPVAVIVIAMSIITSVSVLLATETFRKDLVTAKRPPKLQPRVGLTQALIGGLKLCEARMTRHIVAGWRILRASGRTLLNLYFGIKSGIRF